MTSYNKGQFGLWGRIDQPVRVVSGCKSLLDDAYYLIKDTKHEHLKKMIDAALQEAAALAIEESDKLDERR